MARVNITSMFFMFLFITFVLWGFYDYLTTPSFRIFPLLVPFFFVMYIFLTRFGEYLGFVFKKKNFLTRKGGLVGVYSHHEHHSGGLSTYYFYTYSRYAKHSGFRDYKERNAIERFMTRLSNVRLCYITDKADFFREVKESEGDCPEGCIMYEGSMRKGVRASTPKDEWEIERNMYLDKMSELNTLVEKAKAVSEAAAISQNVALIDAALQLGTAAENISKAFKQKEEPDKK